MTSLRPTAALALCLGLAGCCDDCDDFDDCTTCGTNVVYEVEVNDTAPQANWLGVLYPGDALSIRGHVTQLGPDLFDGFAFVTGGPMQVDVALWADSTAADLDLCVWDPELGVYVTCFETSSTPEAGSFTVLEAGKEIHLVVRSFHGNSAYWLDVAGVSVAYGAQAAAAPAASRAQDAWDAYAPAPASADAEQPGRDAVLLGFAADGSLISSAPARVLPLPRR